MSNTIKVLFRNRIVLIFILFVFMFSGTVFAYDYGKEYSENTEDYDVYSMVLDGQPRIIIIYTESMVVLDLINLKPLFDLSGEQQQLTTIFQQEYYNQKYSSLSRDHFKNLLANELSLDASFPCQAIDYDKIIIDKAIISSEEYAIKKFIPKKCIEAPLDCKEIVNNAKSAINQIAKIDNYASPQVILAVYCKGESAWVIPKIIAPARQIDAITTNIQERAYLTGQIESLYSSKTELQSQLSYGTRNLGDFGRDGYFAMKEAGDFLHKSAVQTGNVFLSFANKITNLFGVNISKAIMEEPEYWSQKLAKTRNLSSQQYTNDDLASSQLFSEQATTKSMNKLNRLKTRNMLIHNDVDII